MQIPLSFAYGLNPLRIPECVAAWIWLSIARVSSYHQTEDEIEAERKIIELCKENPRYFAPIYEKYYEQIFVFIYKRTDDEELTADLTSMVFMKCLKNLHKYKFQGVPMSAWLFRIAVNEVNQYYRYEKRRERAVNLKTEDISVLFDEIEIDDGGDSPEVLVEKLLKLLKPEEVQFLELRFFEGRSFREIGYYLDMTEVNAKVKTYRILKKLRRSARESGIIK